MSMFEHDANADARDFVPAGIQGLETESIVRRVLRDCAGREFRVTQKTIRDEMRWLMELAALEHGAAPGQYRIAAA